ncbi:MAG: anhydro-N-acetylmuramic acid kinase [Pseudomonadota bacterium]|nr:anhydro-N-acetylmuramic acid kinase [Pseudomonadota bacterium]
MTQSTAQTPLRVLGTMSGTSVDGIDLAILETDGETVSRIGPHGTFAYRPEEQQAIRAAFGRVDPGEAAVHAVTEAHGRAIADFLGSARLTAADIDLIGFHGQTTFHDPKAGVTVQAGDAEALSRRFGVPVVADFRKADVAAGGEGAPLAPLFHVAMTAGLERPLAVLNLGGVGNVTWIGAGEAPPVAFDTGPANALVDDWMRLRTGQSHDAGGAAALAGTVDRAWLRDLMQHPYFARPVPKSLDREAFRPAAWPDLPVEDGAATLVAFTAAAVAAAVPHLPAAPLRWLVTGGGRHNPAIMAALSEVLGVPVQPVEAAGWDGDAVEAQAFAWLAARSVRGLPLSLPTTTGVPRPMPGGRLVRAA